MEISKQIINSLLNHEINKQEAINKIDELLKMYLSPIFDNVEILETGFTSENNHGIIKVKFPYGYSKIQHLKKGQIIEISILPT